MENSNRNIKASVGLIIAAVCASLGGLVFLPFYLIAPALMAAVMIRSKNVSLCAFLFLPVIVASFLLSDSSVLPSMLSYAALIILPSAAIWYCQKSKRGGFITAVAATGCSIVCLYCIVCLRGILSGDGAFYDVQLAMQETVRIMQSLIERFRTPETSSVLDAYLSELNAFSESVSSIVVPMLIIFGSVIGLSNTLFFQLFIKKDREALGIPAISKFSEWRVPRFFTGGMVLLILGSVILMITDSPSAEAVSSTISVIFSIPFIIQGLALIDFLILNSKKNVTVKRVIIYILCGLLIPFASSVLVMTGCFEQLFRIRDKLSQGKNPFHRDNGGKSDL